MSKAFSVPATLVACGALVLGSTADAAAPRAADRVAPPAAPRDAPHSGECGVPDLAEDEPLGEAREALGARDVCIASVLLGAGLGCLAATAACTGATYITVGGAAYPCTLVLAGACIAGPLGAQAYAMIICK